MHTIIVRSVLVLGLLGCGLLAAAAAPVVQRGGATGGPGTVSVRSGHGLVATWNTQTGTLDRVSLGDTILMTGPSSPSWFADLDHGGQVPLTYRWKGYRVRDGQAVLLHELKEPGGPGVTVEEQPRTVVGPEGLLSLQRTFTVKSGSAPVTLVKRIRTGTPGGLTLPIRTDGRLCPLGLDDNLQADVTMRSAGPTVITTVFNGHWVDPPVNMKKESTP